MATCLDFQTTLSYVADYAGKTLTGDENTRNLYSGTFEMTVNWGDENGEDNSTARIVDHDSQDVGTIFLSEIDIDGDDTTDPGAFSAADATDPQRSVRLEGQRCSTGNP